MDSVKESCIVLMLNPNMLADGLRTSLGQLTLQILHPHVTGVFGNEKIAQAIQFAYEQLKLVIEPSSAVAWLCSSGKSLNSAASESAQCLIGGNVEWLRPWSCLDGDRDNVAIG